MLSFPTGYLGTKCKSGTHLRSVVIDVFDPDGNGQINYDEFLRGVMGEMNQRRQAIVKKAFAVIDSDKSGVLDINDIKGRYNAKKHPDVIAGK